MCKHIRKGLEQGHLKKALLNVEWHVCQDCKADNKTQEKSEEETDESPSIWLCLKCGHRVSPCFLVNFYSDLSVLPNIAEQQSFYLNCYNYVLIIIILKVMLRE